MRLRSEGGCAIYRRWPCDEFHQLRQAETCPRCHGSGQDSTSRVVRSMEWDRCADGQELSTYIGDMREVDDRAASTPLLDRTISPRTLHDPPEGGSCKERSDIVERPSKRVSRTVVGVVVKVRLLLMQRCSALWLVVRFHSRFFVLAVVDLFYPG